MRVTHIITRLIVGGAQENTVASVLGLREKPSLQVDLISGPTAGTEGSLEDAFHPYPDTLHLAPHLVRPVSPFTDIRAFGELTALLRRLKPDIVHTHSSKAGILGRLAAHRAGVPIIIHTIHGPSFGSFQGRLTNLLFTAAERFAARVTTHFVTVAHAMTEQFLRARIGRPEQFTRVFSGFPLTPFLQSRNDLSLRQQHGLQPDDFVVGKIARLFELKGHDVLIEAAPALINRHPNIRFLLVGGGPWRDQLEAKVRARNLTRHFVFTGLVPPGEIAKYAGIMDCLVHLSAREGLARALPQALAAGRPVVAYDCDGAREICLDHETGFLIPSGDRARLIESLGTLANDPALREKLGRRGQKIVQERFPVERMVDDLYDLYQRLARRRGLAS
jgi:glycosyltransferase involved in cell wall biosynthesis